MFAALGDETRLNIVTRLCATGPQSIVRLTAGTKISRQAITKHLHALVEAGLVRSTLDGRERIWQLQTKRLADVRTTSSRSRVNGMTRSSGSEPS